MVAPTFKEFEQSLANHLHKSRGLPLESIEVELRADKMEAREQEVLRQGVRQVVKKLLSSYAPSAVTLEKKQPKRSKLAGVEQNRVVGESGNTMRSNPHLVDRDGLPLSIKFVENTTPNHESSQQNNALQQKYRATCTLQFAQKQKNRIKLYQLAKPVEPTPAPRVRFSVNLPRPF